MRGAWRRVPGLVRVLFWIWTGLLVAMEVLAFFAGPAWNDHNDVLDGASGTGFFFLWTIFAAMLWAIGLAVVVITTWVWSLVRRPFVG